MLSFIFGLSVGVVGTYFVIRFKDALFVWKKNTETKIEKALKND